MNVNDLLLMDLNALSKTWCHYFLLCYDFEICQLIYHFHNIHLFFDSVFSFVKNLGKLLHRRVVLFEIWQLIDEKQLKAIS